MNRLLAAVFLLSCTAFAQINNPGGASGDCIAAVASLSSSCGTTKGTLASANNGSSSSDCTTGGGTNVVACIYTGSAWAFAGNAGSSPNWSTIANPSGNLALTMGANTSTFNTTTAVANFFQFANITAALVGASQSSPHWDLCGTEWHAAASVVGCLDLQFIPGTGLDAASTIAVTHTGSATGLVTTTFPGPVQAGASGGVGGTVVLPEGTACTPTASNDFLCADSTAHAIKSALNGGSLFRIPQVIANGTAAMGTGAITSGTCATAVTVSATGVATTDAISATPNADPTGVTGYAVSATGSLYIQAYPTANNVNFKVCNNTSGSLTPSALTLNWVVTR